MAVIGFEVTERRAYDGGVDRPYERVDGIARYAVEADREAANGIVDIELAPRADDGLVHFDGDVTILRPLEGARRTGIVEVPNRGRRTLLGLYDRAAPVVEPTAEIDPGDGFLLRHGFTIAWCGWQWDVPRSPARMGLTAPVAAVAGELQLRLQLHDRAERVELTDQHTGQLGNHRPIPTADVADPDARLLVRDGLWSEPAEIDRARWCFDSATTVSLDGGFEPGRIYDLIYRTPSSPVAGTGLLAVRDFGRYLRASEQLDHVLATGQSQCGRFLRTFLHLGLNHTDDGPAYDGMLVHIAGGRRGEFNHRFAQPSVQTTPSFGHLFPFADEPQTDPHSGRHEGLLDRQVAAGSVPKIIYTNTSSEYWRGDAFLAHASAVDGGDVEPPHYTRHYLLSSTQHGPGMLPLMQESMFGSKGGNAFNIVDYTPLLRAAMLNLAAWVEFAVEPPRSAVPRLDDGTAVTRAEALATIEARTELPPVVLPAAGELCRLHPLDLGPEAPFGIGSYPAGVAGDAYPCFVSAVNDDGNEVAGVAMPDVTVPVAAHTGWNPRRFDSGAPEQILDYVGSTVPFTVEQIVERYGDEERYLARIELATNRLVLEGFLLPEDVELCKRIAAKRYRAVVSAGAPAPPSIP